MEISIKGEFNSKVQSFRATSKTINGYISSGSYVSTCKGVTYEEVWPVGCESKIPDFGAQKSKNELGTNRLFGPSPSLDHLRELRRNRTEGQYKPGSSQ